VVIALWLVAVVALAPASMKVSEVTTDETATADSLPSDSQSAEVARTLRERFPGGEQFLALAVYRREGGLEPADREKIQTDALAIAEVEGVDQVAAPFALTSPPELVAEDGSVAFTAIPLLPPQSEERTEAIEEIREITGEGAAGLAIRTTGPAALQSDLTTTLESTDAALLFATAGLVLFLLVAIYRSPVIALIPLLVVAISYTVATGLIRLIAGGLDETIDRTAITLLAVLMFGAGTDYCLLLVARYSSDLRDHDDKHDAIREAYRRAAPAIAASGVVVAGALLTLLAAQLHSNRVFGPVNALGVLTGLLASLTLLPALLAAVGRRGFWPSRKLVARRATGEGPALLPGLGALPDFKRRMEDTHPSVRERDPIWRRIGVRALRRPVLTLVLCGGLLGAMALGLTQYEREVNVVTQFRTATDSTEGYELLQAGFPPGTLYPNTVLVEREDGPLAPGDVERAQETVRAVEGVAAVTEPTRTSEDERAATFVATFADDPFRQPALDRVETIRSQLADLGPGLTAIVGDGSALRLDYGDAASADQRRIIPLVLLVITLTLVVLLRAIVAPLYLLATVVISFFATLGVSLVVFDVVFGEPRVDPLMPFFAFVFLVALGVDYNIFYMHRVRDEAARHGTTEGVLRALVATGPVITSAGIVLAGTFAVLMTLPLDILLEVGFCVALGVLIDTFLVRTLVVPAIARLVGDASWWPSRLRSPRDEQPAAPRAGVIIKR
jgi:RND superfamily putative drug exporter